jgi:hypothetical protein
MTEQPSNASGLLRVRKFFIPAAVLAETIACLQDVGKAGYEGFAVWGGIHVDSETFRFTRVIIPRQRAFVSSKGLLVIVDGEALFQVNRTLHESRELLGGQVHTHPTSAYHSSTDDHYPLVTLLGALSVVIPDFARHAPGDLEFWAWYRLAEYGSWTNAAEKTEIVLE